MLYSPPTLPQETAASLPKQNNIFTHHARYNYEEMKPIMPVDTIFVTILRDPVLLTESLFSYYNVKGIYKEKSLIHFLETFFSSSPNTSAYHTLFSKRVFGKIGRNQMSFDLGFRKKHFDDLEIIKNFIENIDSQFHLVMIADRMEESLIHLQHLLCWTLEDVVVFRHNARKRHASQNLSTALKENIRFFNKADELLYQYFCAKLTRQTKAFGKAEMEKQISSLQHATELIFNKCVEKVVPMGDLESSKLNWYSDMVLGFKQTNNTDKLCQDLTTSELLYTDSLRIKQGLQIGVSKVYANTTV